jgi:hypothetical protein
MSVVLQVTKAEVEAMRTEKGSKLLPFKDEVIYMRNEGITFCKIQKWFGQKNVATSQENIRQFFKRHKNEFLNVEFQLKNENNLLNKELEYASKKDISEIIPF